MAMKSKSNSAQLKDFLTETAQGRSYVVIVSTVSLLLIVMLAGVLPGVSAVLEQINEIGAKQEALGKLEQKEVTLNNLLIEEQSKEKLLTYFDKKFPDTMSEESLLRLMDKYAKDDKLTLEAVSFTAIEARRSIPTIFEVPPKVQAKNLNLIVSGQLGNVHNFIKIIESESRIINIVSFSIQKEEKTQQGGTADYQLTLRAEVYFWDQTFTEDII